MRDCVCKLGEARFRARLQIGHTQVGAFPISGGLADNCGEEFRALSGSVLSGKRGPVAN